MDNERDKKFFWTLAICTLIAALTYRIPSVAMWVGFAFAGYSVIANDSIQTLGTFLCSNRKRPWWHLWIYVGGIFLVTTLYSFYTYHGDVSYGRLMAEGFDKAPTSFTFLQMCAPLVLLVLTRCSIPVSTTFLVLSAFAASGTSLRSVIFKSTTGYYIAFLCAFGLWMLTYHLFVPSRRRSDDEPGPWWALAQWISSGALWSVWIMQDAANVGVYLPRGLNGTQCFTYCFVLVIGLGLLMYQGGGAIQEVVSEKHQTSDIRQATLINFVYAMILYYFKALSNIPMSTTWVFVGLLAGRELGLTLASHGRTRSRRETLHIIAKDLGRVSLGLFVSVVLAVIVNPIIRFDLLGF
ncbi:MAG: hypothetical protein AB7S38_13380 [Vulcanimicrobiota bacterium]